VVEAVPEMRSDEAGKRIPPEPAMDFVLVQVVLECERGSEQAEAAGHAAGDGCVTVKQAIRNKQQEPGHDPGPVRQ
jgi:hypothetical protein